MCRRRQNIFAINGFRQRACRPSCGLILKPWGERERSDQQIIGELQGKFSRHCRRQDLLPRRRRPFRSCAAKCRSSSSSTIRATIRELAEVLDKIDAGGEEERPVHLHQHRSALRDAAGGTDHRQGQAPTSSALPCSDVGATLATLLGGNNVNRFTIAGPQLSGDPAGAARFTANRRTGCWNTRCARRSATWCRCRSSSQLEPVGAAQQPRHLPAAQFGDALQACRSPAARSARR